MHDMQSALLVSLVAYTNQGLAQEVIQQRVPSGGSCEIDFRSYCNLSWAALCPIELLLVYNLCHFSTVIVQILMQQPWLIVARRLEQLEDQCAAVSDTDTLGRSQLRASAIC